MKPFPISGSGFLCYFLHRIFVKRANFLVLSSYIFERRNFFMETKKRKKVMVVCCICCGLVALITIGAAVTKQNKSKCKADETLGSEVLFSCSDTTDETEITSESITEAVSVRIQDTLKDTSSNNETGEKESCPNNISKMKTTTVKTEKTEKTEKTTASNASVTTAATTKRQIPCGSNQDINPEQLKAEANKHLGSFSNVEVSSTLNKNNSCWTLTVNSFNNQKVLQDIKECAEIEYNECVNAGYLNRGAPIKMYVDYEAKARDDLGPGVCYYTFYIFYL